MRPNYSYSKLKTQLTKKRNKELEVLCVHIGSRITSPERLAELNRPCNVSSKPRPYNNVFILVYTTFSGR